MFTNNLKKIVARRKKRLGRGAGSGKGFHTVGSGQKGQTSRAGSHVRRAFEGGQNPISRRLPVLKGNKSRNVATTAIRISKLLGSKVFNIDKASLVKLSSQKNLKLVGDSSYDGFDLSKVVIKDDVKLTKSLKDEILAAGGVVEEKSEAEVNG